MSHDAFDPVDLLARLDGDRELMIQLAQIFLADAPSTVSEARRALEANDAADLARAAHSLKGAAGCLGADAAWAAADALEAMGRAGDLAGADAALARLTDRIDEVAVVLDRVCSEAQS